MLRQLDGAWHLIAIPIGVALGVAFAFSETVRIWSPYGIILPLVFYVSAKLPRKEWLWQDSANL